MAADAEENEKEMGCLQQIILCVLIVLLTYSTLYFFNAYDSKDVIIANLISGGILFAVGVLIANNYTFGSNAQRRLLMSSAILFVFGLACVFTPIGTTSIGLTRSPSSPIDFDAEVPAQGGMVGPIEVPPDIKGTVDVKIEQNIDPGEEEVFQRWSYVAVALLDENKNYLVGFGEEFWNEAGYDDEYHWEEENTWSEVELRFPSPGTYFARISTESNVSMEELGPVKISMSGSVPVHLWQVKVASLFAFLLGGIFLGAGYYD